MKPDKTGGNSHTKARPSLLKQLAQAPDKLFSQSFRQQYGALCFRYDEGSGVLVLVITSRASKRWIIPKGWPIKGKKPHEVAATEAWEEAGVRGKVEKKAVGSYTYLKEIEGGNVVPCVVDVFQLEVSELDGNFKERGQRALAWVAPDEAARRVREIELKSLLVEFKPRKSRRRTKD
jgi:8-oxo-dGTP pyrophosphatase MutT (NUDIX family)